MKYWDASAIIPLIAAEPTRDNLLKLIAAALARREREALLTAAEVTSALTTMPALAGSWHEIVPSDSIVELPNAYIALIPYLMPTVCN